MISINRPLKNVRLPVPRNFWYRFAGLRKSVDTEVYTEEEQAWDKLVISTSPNPHYMQSSAWGESKAKTQWPVSRFIGYDANGILPLQVFSRTVPSLGRLHYVPNVTGITPEIIPALTSQLKSQYGKGMVLKLECYQPHSDDLIQAFTSNGWLKANSVQARSTVIVDIQGTSDELFTRIKKRARYEVRVAERSGVRVEKVEVNEQNLKHLTSLMNITAKRSGSFFRKESYTTKYWKAFSRTEQAHLYFAWHEMDLLAGAFVVTYGKTGWYKDGGSVRQKSNLMGPRFLQWEIMRDLQTMGITHYDLSGIPAESELETSSMKGLYTFKTGFAHETTHFMPAMELPFGKRHPVWSVSEPQFLRLYSGFRKDFWY